MRKTTLLLAGLAVAALLVPAALGAKGGKPKPPPDPPPAADPAIVYTGGWTSGRVPDRLVVMNADGSNGTVILEMSRILEPSWSPDGSAIAFSDGQSVWRIDVDVVEGVPVGSGLTRLHTDPGLGLFAVRWSPNGDEILFDVGDEYGACLLRVVPATGGDATTLYTSPVDPWAHSPTWNRDGTLIAFAEGDRVKVLSRASLTVVHTSVALSPKPGDLDWARTQDVLVYEAEVDGTDVVCTHDLASGETATLHAGRWPTWSPDDTRILFNGPTTKGRKSAALLLYDLATGSVEKLEDANGRFLDWRR